MKKLPSSRSYMSQSVVLMLAVFTMYPFKGHSYFFDIGHFTLSFPGF